MPRSLNDPKIKNKVGKLLAWGLRHEPEKMGITLDPQGWAIVKDVVRAIKDRGMNINAAFLEEIVRDDNKGRYALSKDRRRIKACQGHSVEVDLGLSPVEPPETLYHGTVQSSVGPILKDGLKAMSRQYLHLSVDVETATVVGQRRQGQLVIFAIRAKEASDAGCKFYISENKVWLTDSIPTEFIDFHVQDH